MKKFFVFCSFCFILNVYCHNPLITMNNTESNDDLSLFDAEQNIMMLEDGLDDWHEKYVRYYVDPRFRILTVSSIFDQKDLEGGGFIFYALSNIFSLIIHLFFIKLLIICF